MSREYRSATGFTWAATIIVLAAMLLVTNASAAAPAATDKTFSPIELEYLKARSAVLRYSSLVGAVFDAGFTIPDSPSGQNPYAIDMKFVAVSQPAGEWRTTPALLNELSDHVADLRAALEKAFRPEDFKKITEAANRPRRQAELHWTILLEGVTLMQLENGPAVREEIVRMAQMAKAKNSQWLIQKDRAERAGKPAPPYPFDEAWLTGWQQRVAHAAMAKMTATQQEKLLSAWPAMFPAGPKPPPATQPAS